FTLHDLRVRVEEVGAQCTCSMRVGDHFTLSGGKLALPDGASFCLYAMQAVFPLLPAKQRLNHPADWMETDARCTCPDPACRLIMVIERTGLRTFRHDEVSAQVPWEQVRAGVEAA
ncbi:MAG: TIGR04076 family protein, partial [Rubrivivax sp.]